MSGRDYLAGAAWVLQLTPQQLASATAVTIWLRASKVHQPSRASYGMTAVASMTVQTVTHTGSEYHAGSSRAVHFGPRALFKPVSWPAGSPMLLPLQLHWLPLLRRLGVQSRMTAATVAAVEGDTADSATNSSNQQGSSKHGSASSTGTSKQGQSSTSTCWRPAVVLADSLGAEHISVNESVASLQSASRGSAPMAFVLVDPRCSYSLSLNTDLFARIPSLLLAHASSATGILVSILLLVLSHQLNVLSKLAAAHLGQTTPAPGQQGRSVNGTPGPPTSGAQARLIVPLRRR